MPLLWIGLLEYLIKPNRKTSFVSHHEIEQIDKFFKKKEIKEFIQKFNQEKKTDIRIIAATNKNMEEAVEEGRFREDLFYRLDVVKIHLPPLRDRKSDIPLLMNHFLDIYSEKNRKEIKNTSQEAMEVLMRYSWPGNVRELENAMERAVIICQDDTILPEHLPERVVKGEEQEPSNILDYEEAKEVFEKKYLRNLLKMSGGNVSKSAKTAGMTRQNIYIKLNKYNINPKVYYPRE